MGNDYLVLDPKAADFELNPAWVRLICDRNFGAGGDGILYGAAFEDGMPALRIFNPDGSEAEKSGNGIRIFLHDRGYVRETAFVLRTFGGDVEVRYLNADASLIRVAMGRLTFNSAEIPVAGPEREVVDEVMEFAGERHAVTCVSVGNPHCVIPMRDISREKAIALGTVVERAPQFPNRTNMQLLKVLDRRNIAIEIFERGAGYTPASGSSSCAAAGAAHRLGLVDDEITVHMPGGALTINIEDDGRIHMTGPVKRVAAISLADDFIRELLAL